MIVGVVAVLILPVLLKPGSTRDIGITGSAPAALAATIAQQAHAAGITARVHPYASLAAGEQAVRQGQVDVLVADARRLEWKGRADEQLKAVVTGAIQLATVRERAATAGISPGAMAALLAPAPVASVQLGPVAGRSPGDEMAVLVMTVVLFFGISVFGQMVLTGVLEEKASRVVEVLLARDPGSRPAGRQDRRHRAARAGADRRDRAGRARRRQPPSTPSMSPPSGARCWPGPWSGSCWATPCTPPCTAPSDRSGRGSRTPRPSPGRSRS